MPVDACVELAGFAAAHSLCVIANGQALNPLSVSQRGSETVTVIHLSGGRPEDIEAAGRRWLEENPDQAERALTVVDGYITTASVKMDALILDVRSYGTRAMQMKMAVPYRPANGSSRFAVHRPKFIVAQLAGHDSAALRQAFFRGVFRHDKGSRVWNASVDQSR